MKSFDQLRGVKHSGFGVGGVYVHLVGEREGDVVLCPPLDIFRVEECAFDVGIQVEWVPRISQSRGRQMFDSGTTWRLYECEAGLRFDFNSEMLGVRPYKRLFVNKEFSRATLQMSEECLESREADPLGYPLDELLIMHRLTQEKAIELHGCGIVRANGVGNLFVGHSGAGKSTTTRLWISREEVEVLSDDRIIVRPDAAHTGSSSMRMYGTPCMAKRCSLLLTARRCLASSCLNTATATSSPAFPRARRSQNCLPAALCHFIATSMWTPP